ncbi:SMI1/KNR4 family protein [Actinocorallia aurantiaca]|uniref:SMI1/KNR4 family protein n=1 Tax=Actinocorallia aurantiaca TaxID=46204 RepID=UPI0031D64919
MTEEEIITRIREFHFVAGTDLPAPATEAVVEELEAVVGLAMPPLLKRLYLEVSDGGFNDWGNAYPLTREDERCCYGHGPVLQEYLWSVKGKVDPDETLPVPGFLVPFAHMGCSIYHFVDWSTPEGRVWAIDADAGHYQLPLPWPTLGEQLVNDMDKVASGSGQRRGRLVHVLADPNGNPIEIQSAHDGKSWTVIDLRRHPTAGSPWPAWSVRVNGPAPRSTEYTEHTVTITPHSRGRWWMDLASPDSWL